jgi:hypothetical protein
MKTIYATQIYDPKKIIISDEILTRIKMWVNTLSKIEVKENERVECTLSIDGYRNTEVDGVIHVNSEYYPESPVISIERGYSKDDPPILKSDVAFISISSKGSSLYLCGEEGPDYILHLRDQDLLDIPDVFFSEDFIGHLSRGIEYGHNELTIEAFLQDFVPQEHKNILIEEIIKWSIKNSKHLMSKGELHDLRVEQVIKSLTGIRKK